MLAGFVIVAVFIAGYFYFLKSKKDVVETGVVGTAKAASELVPEIQTNPGEKVPEVNPLDRANPFKYTNPLR